jgi:hypothetical protein
VCRSLPDPAVTIQPWGQQGPARSADMGFSAPGCAQVLRGPKECACVSLCAYLILASSPGGPCDRRKHCVPCQVSRLNLLHPERQGSPQVTAQPRCGLTQPKCLNKDVAA